MFGKYLVHNHWIAFWFIKKPFLATQLSNSKWKQAMDVHNQPLSEQTEADTSLEHRWTHGGLSSESLAMLIIGQVHIGYTLHCYKPAGFRRDSRKKMEAAFASMWRFAALSHC